jgi:hypothetical protein
MWYKAGSVLHFHFHGVEEEELISGYLPYRIGPKGIHALRCTVRAVQLSLGYGKVSDY